MLTNKILVDKCVRDEKDSCTIYNELIILLTERLDLGDRDIVTTTEYIRLPRADKFHLWKELQAVCLHASSTVAVQVFLDACRNGVPVIVVREAHKSINAEAWSLAIQSAGWDLDPEEVASTTKLFYMVHEAFEIKGAVRWITDYYPTLRESIIEKQIAKMKDDEAKAKCLYENMARNIVR